MTVSWGAGRRTTRVAGSRGWGERFVTACLLWLLALPLAVAQPQRTVLVMGDSLSAGYGLAAAESWVALLGERLARERPGWRVVNASISGETTAGGVARIDAELAEHEPDVVVVELGANDGLRGLPLDIAEANLARMITASQAAGAKVLLVGMEIPPNYGPDYTTMFRTMFRTLAERHGTALLPFLLEPIARERDAFLDDNLHPTAAAQPRLLEHVWPALLPVIDAATP